MGGGGGGGDRSPTPPSKGKLPKLATRQFVPPAAVIRNPDPKLVMEPTLVIQPDANIPKSEHGRAGRSTVRNPLLPLMVQVPAPESGPAAAAASDQDRVPVSGRAMAAEWVAELTGSVAACLRRP